MGNQHSLKSFCPCPWEMLKMAMHGAEQELTAPAETATLVSTIEMLKPGTMGAGGGGQAVRKGRVWEALRHLREVGQGIFGETATGSVVTAAEGGGCGLRRRMGSGTEETAGAV